MGAKPEVVFVVPYPCPHCRATLEGRTAARGAWLRCPRCGKASRPPDSVAAPPELRKRPDDVFVIDEATAAAPPPPPMTPAAAAAAELPRHEPPGARPGRVIASAGLFVSVCLTVYAFLDRSTTLTAGFALAAVAFLVATLALPAGPGAVRD